MTSEVTTDVRMPLPREPGDPQGEMSVVTGESAPDVHAAVARMIDKNRDVTECELLLTGVVEMLGSGPLGEPELLRRLNQVWPAAGVTAPRLEAALKVGETGELLCQAASLGGEHLWALTRSGICEVKATASWSEDMYARAASQVREKAIEAFGRDPGLEKALLWARAIRRAVDAGVSNGRSVYAGSVDALDAASLTPLGIDRGAMLASVSRWTSDDEVAGFLHVCVLSALDPTDPFGTELVTNVVTACLLHAAVARRDVAGAARDLGPLRGQRLILDTPVLLQLMGPDKTSDPVSRTLRAAVAAGMNVVVAEHTLTELGQALENVEKSEAAMIAAVESDRMAAEEFGRLVDGQILSLFAGAVSDSQVKDWSDFTRVAREDLPQRLVELGVQRREHGNLDRSVVLQCQEALVTTLDARGGGRSPANVLSDAESMAMAWRKRRRDERDPSTRAWPGAWVVSTDRAIAPAMRQLVSDVWPYTLTVSQLTMLLTRCQEVPSVVELSQAAAVLVAYEAAESIACRYPPNVAIELAHAIAADEKGRCYDVRVAQTMTLEAILADGETQDVALVTSRVVGELHRRRTGAMAFQRELLTESRLLAERDAERARGDVAAERGAVEVLRIELRDERAERVRAETERTESNIAERPRSRVSGGRGSATEFSFFTRYWWWLGSSVGCRLSLWLASQPCCSGSDLGAGSRDLTSVLVRYWLLASVCRPTSWRWLLGCGRISLEAAYPGPLGIRRLGGHRRPSCILTVPGTPAAAPY